MRNNETSRGDLSRSVCAHQAEYLVKARGYLKLHSYDELAVVLLIAANSYESSGVTERYISEELGIPRSTMNRLLNTLLSGGTIKVLPDVAPRQFIYNMNFTNEAYGEDGPAVRNEFYLYVLKKYASMTKMALENLAHSQFDKP
jgi:hypothetical protein